MRFTLKYILLIVLVVIALASVIIRGYLTYTLSGNATYFVGNKKTLEYVNLSGNVILVIGLSVLLLLN